MKSLRIVTIGGGGGHAQVLKGLRMLGNVAITAICPSTDSGGSTGQLARDYGGMGFLGDLTKCIAALCPHPRLAEALMHRFDAGSLAGHSVKNTLFLGLQRTAGISAALTMMYQLADIAPHRVLPVTTRRTELRARLKFGTELRGETNIDRIAQNPLWHPDTHAVEGITLKPAVRADSGVLAALKGADWVVVCPGDLYSSILPVLLPGGMTPAIARSGARIAIVLNIVTKKGETQGYRADDFVRRIEQYLGRPCDAIIANTAAIPKRFRLAYALESKVQLASPTVHKDRRVLALPLIKGGRNGGLYHDERKLARALERILMR